MESLVLVLRALILMVARAESNHQHADFQSAAGGSRVTVRSRPHSGGFTSGG